MNRMGRDTVSVVMDKLPILNKVMPLSEFAFLDAA